MAGEPFSGNVYLFCNRERKLLKAVYWDKTGFWLSQKRLEKDKYPWPQDEGTHGGTIADAVSRDRFFQSA